MTRPRRTVPPDAPQLDDDDERYDLGDLELAHWPRPSLPEPGHGHTETEHALDDLRTLPSAYPGPPDNDVTRDRASARHEPGHGQGHAHDHDFDRAIDELGPRIELDVPSDARVRSKPSLPSSRPPRPSTVRSSSNRADDGSRAALALAGYGAAPAGLFASAGYVIRVVKRMRILRDDRRALEQRARAEADQHVAALAALGRVLAREQVVVAHPGLEEARARVQVHESELAQRSEAANLSRATDKAALAELSAKQKALESELAPFLAAERAAASAHVRSEAELKRKRAQAQRLDIELRALERASTPPPPDRRAQLEQEQQARAAETASHERAHEETTRALGLARRELALRRGHLDALARESTQRSTRARRLDARLEDDVARAREALDVQLGALAEAARALALTSSGSEEVAQVVASEQRLDELVSRLALYDRALSLYDLGGLVKGALVWLALLGVCVLATWLLTAPS